MFVFPLLLNTQTPNLALTNLIYQFQCCMQQCRCLFLLKESREETTVFKCAMFRRTSHHVNILQPRVFSRGNNHRVYLHVANEALYNLHDLTTSRHVCLCIYVCMSLCVIHTAQTEL